MHVTAELTAILPKRRGALADLLDVLDQAGVAARALCLVDTGDYALARFVPDDADKGRAAVEQAGIPCATAAVLVIPSDPGRLAEALHLLAEARAPVFYVYAGASVTVLGCPDAERAA